MDPSGKLIYTRNHNILSGNLQTISGVRTLLFFPMLAGGSSPQGTSLVVQVSRVNGPYVLHVGTPSTFSFCVRVYVYRHSFYAVAFTSYGAFWMSYATILIPRSGVLASFTRASELESGLGIYLIAWFIVWDKYVLLTRKTIYSFNHIIDKS